MVYVFLNKLVIIFFTSDIYIYIINCFSLILYLPHLKYEQARTPGSKPFGGYDTAPGSATGKKVRMEVYL